MSDSGSISRLDKLRALEAWLDWQLHQTRARIREVEAQERQGPREPRGEEPSKQGERQVEEQRRARTPDWGLIEAGIGSPATEVHRGDCWAAGKRLQEISRERAIAELADAARACEVCRPDRVLGSRASD
ncbi:DUF6233 domain-containing protein [Streptomyces sp. NBC_01221]|uniref:DUF6233 domain-containing protein n=1 Tax=Streptomyces sp. NBC_01221 TaxID=2903782 RepID=UPI00225AAA82|nr:DUF6233 domain-containing protein [Streptomyces sp. NBC_01221]MCX4792538.1 DUF6233 domain-containing protein [Streptomyces sp. NBC_01221]